MQSETHVYQLTYFTSYGTVSKTKHYIYAVIMIAHNHVFVF